MVSPPIAARRTARRDHVLRDCGSPFLHLRAAVPEPFEQLVARHRQYPSADDREQAAGSLDSKRSLQPESFRDVDDVGSNRLGGCDVGVAALRITVPEPGQPAAVS